MDGVLSNTQRLLIRAVLDHIDDMARRIEKLDDFIQGEMEKYDEAIKRLDGIPGVGVLSAQTILAEIGLDMNQFPTADHLAVWAGVCPGNNISAGKRKNSTKIIAPNVPAVWMVCRPDTSISFNRGGAANCG